MRNARPTPRPRHDGFTLTELLVVISLIVFLVGLAFPVISSLQSGSRIEAGLNTVGMAADVARQWVKPSAWDADATDSVQYEQYSGCAALFTPDGDIRIITNTRNARSSAGSGVFLEDWARRPSPIVPNGYVDRSGVDYINIPSGVGVAGIVRQGNNAFFIAPPFAIAFDQNGQLYHGYVNAPLHRGDSTGRIYYDGTVSGSSTDGRYDLRGVRNNSYDPKDWDGSAGSNNEDVISEDRPIRALPFEAIDCVPGVVIYNKDDFEGLGFDFSGGGKVDLSSNAGQWLQENGKIVFFSPHTGVALRDEKE